MFPATQYKKRMFGAKNRPFGVINFLNTHPSELNEFSYSLVTSTNFYTSLDMTLLSCHAR